MNRGYEAHITYNREHAPKLIYVVDKNYIDSGWKYSGFDSDPIMGHDKPFSYLTGYSEDPDILMRRMRQVVKNLQSMYGIYPLREKIEEIIYDTKTGRDWRQR